MGQIQKHTTTSSGKRLRVAIAGFGEEGEAILRYLQAQGGMYDITILDQSFNPKKAIPDGVASDLRADVFNDELLYDIIWRASPSIAPYRLKTSGQITSMTAEFLANCPAPIIGVTGTKGKGTTTMLISHILQNAGRQTHIVGNIGIPALEKLASIKQEDIVVFEMSSFQLWDMKQSPHIAVVLMVEPEHLDVHRDITDYTQAKANIARWQGSEDSVIYHPNNVYSKQIAQVGLGQKIRYLSTEGANISDGKLMINGQVICAVSDFGLLGEHNHENIAAAVTAAWQYTQNIPAFAESVRAFKGLEHRLEYVAEHGGVRYYDDSFATTPATAIAALRAFNQDKVMILGGSDKGSDFNQLAQAIAGANVTGVVLIGHMAAKIGDALIRAGYNGMIRQDDSLTTMDAIVNTAAAMTKRGDVVLLSPACASFGLFANYKERGDLFKQVVRSLV